MTPVSGISETVNKKGDGRNVFNPSYKKWQEKNWKWHVNTTITKYGASQEMSVIWKENMETKARTCYRNTDSIMEDDKDIRRKNGKERFYPYNMNGQRD